METFHSFAPQQAVIAWIFIICGALAILFSLFFLLIIKYSFFKGLAVTLLVTGILQIVFGCYSINVWDYTPIINVRLADGMLSLNDAAIARQAYLARIFTWISLSTATCGTLLYVFCFRATQAFWRGLGFGMAIQSVLSAALFFAERTDLKHYNPYITQQKTEQTQCRKKIDECRNWYSDFS